MKSFPVSLPGGAPIWQGEGLELQAPEVFRSLFFCLVEKSALFVYFCGMPPQSISTKSPTYPKFVSKAGRLTAFGDAVTPTRKQWDESYHDAHHFKPGAVLSFFKKDVDSVVRNTAKYLLEEMPDITRYAMLASIGRMLF